MDWFSVDKEGLAALLEGRGKHRAAFELVQNAWDEAGVTRVTVTIEPVPGSRVRSRLVVEDDAPSGFADLSHAFTLFAPSAKKSDVSKRGRWNLGEKLVLAMCDEAEITSTTGGVRFDAKGRHAIRSRRPHGSRFDAVIRLTTDERRDMIDALATLLPPASIATTVNGAPLTARAPYREFTTTLRTEASDASGILRPTKRATRVSLHHPQAGETPHLYEMGIPVVETDLPWHVDVEQVIPLDFERKNVTPAYARDLRVAVLNATATEITADQAASAWARDAAGDTRASDEAVSCVLTQRFGSKVVSYDPSDIQANAEAVLKGYTVITGGSLSKQEWEQARRAGAIAPAGKVTPSNSTVQFSANGIPPISQDKWTPGMAAVADYAARLGQALLGRPVAVNFHSSPQNFAAAYSPGALTFNLRRLGHRWFTEPDHQVVDALLIHEFAHEKVANHLSEAFHDEMGRLGAALRDVPTRLVIVP